MLSNEGVDHGEQFSPSFTAIVFHGYIERGSCEPQLPASGKRAEGIWRAGPSRSRSGDLQKGMAEAPAGSTGRPSEDLHLSGRPQIRLMGVSVRTALGRLLVPGITDLRIQQFR